MSRPGGAGWTSRWPSDFGGQDENTKLKLPANSMRAEGSPGKEVVTPAGKRKAVACLVDAHGMSERRACKAIGCSRMTIAISDNPGSRCKSMIVHASARHWWSTPRSRASAGRGHWTDADQASQIQHCG